MYSTALSPHSILLMENLIEFCIKKCSVLCWLPFYRSSYQVPFDCLLPTSKTITQSLGSLWRAGLYYLVRIDWVTIIHIIFNIIFFSHRELYRSLVLMNHVSTAQEGYSWSHQHWKCISLCAKPDWLHSYSSRLVQVNIKLYPQTFLTCG